MTITYRKAASDDINTAFALWSKIWDEFIAQNTNASYHEISKNHNLQQEYENGKRIMLIAQDGDKIIGVAGADIKTGSINPPFCVDNAYHRKGIATELLHRIVCELKFAGCDLIKVNSSSYALPFYKKFGFIQAGAEQQHDGFVSIPMEYTPNEMFCMEKFPSLGIKTWQKETLSCLADKILNISPKPLILIDGKAGAGKTSFAVKLADTLNANIVASDDVAWWADPIHWDEEMLTGIIKPWLNGKSVMYKPSGWIKKNRSGAIEVDSNKALIIEGCCACRKTLREVATYSVWIDTDPNISKERVIQRDIEKGENGGTRESVTEFTDWWDSIIDPFLLEEEAWKYADIIISGYHSDLDFKNIATGHCLEV